MKTALLVTLFLAFAIQEPPPEDYPGQRHHGPPPPGWFCTHNDPNPAKKCSCERLDTSDNCEGPVSEDRKCKVWCHKQACHCPIACMPAEPEPGDEPQPPGAPDAAHQH